MKREHLGKRLVRSMAIGAIIFGLLIVSGIFLGTKNDEIFSFEIGILAAACFLGVLAAGIYTSGPREITYSEQGIHIVGFPNRETFARWEQVRFAKRFPSGFLLYISLDSGGTEASLAAGGFERSDWLRFKDDLEKMELVVD